MALVRAAVAACVVGVWLAVPAGNVSPPDCTEEAGIVPALPPTDSTEAAGMVPALPPPVVLSVKDASRASCESRPPCRDLLSTDWVRPCVLDDEGSLCELRPPNDDNG
ncbi:MAG: hypothetical protein J2P17_08975, partial [Mycobacterium sp.]|nr:hypothetical protein [Mycobacterium sp.]